METCVSNLVKKKEKVLVFVNGYFGRRFAEMCERHKANVTVIDKPWGEAFEDLEVKLAVDLWKPVLLFIVHAETSTGVL